MGGESEMEPRGRERKWGDVAKDGNGGCPVRNVAPRTVPAKGLLWCRRVMGQAVFVPVIRCAGGIWLLSKSYALIVPGSGVVFSCC